MNKIKGIYEWYKKFNHMDIIIKTKIKKFAISIDIKALPHLLGLHYTVAKNVKISNKDLINKIRNLPDDKILKQISERNFKMLESVKNRISNFETFMKNLENAILVENTHNTTLKSQHFLIEIGTNKILHLGLINAGYLDIPVEFNVIEQKYLETFIQEKTNKKFSDTKIFEKVESIYKYENEKLKFFSFDEEKQERLNQAVKLNKNINYHQALQEELKVKREKKPDIKAKIEEYKKEISSEKRESKGIKNRDLGL